MDKQGVPMPTVCNADVILRDPSPFLHAPIPALHLEPDHPLHLPADDLRVELCVLHDLLADLH